MIVPILTIGYDPTTGRIVIDPVGAQSMSSEREASFSERVGQYLEFGRQQGGKGGRPWNKQHARMRSDHLKIWGDVLNAKTLDDITLERVESHLGKMRRELKTDDDGKQVPRYSPATVWHVYTALKSFVAWCLKREYMMRDPLRAAVTPNADPQSTRRAFTFDEFRALVAAAPQHRALVYEVAVDTALRSNELRQLTVGHFDAVAEGLRVDPAWDKTRRENFVPLSPELCAKLKTECEGKDAKTPLLRMSSTPIQEFDRDIEKAKIEKRTPAGKVDFHSLRTTAITWFEQFGGTPSDTDVRTFGRHQTSKASARYRRTTQDAMRTAKALVRKQFAGVGIDIGGLDGTRTRDLRRDKPISDFLAASIDISKLTRDLAFEIGSDDFRANIRLLSEREIVRILGGKND